MLFVLVGGIVAYQNIGRLEDPEFTIKEALIVTPYPGASAEEVAQEVTNPIETRLPAARPARARRIGIDARPLGRHGRHSRTATTSDAIPQVWDELRRKIADVQPQLPPSVRGRSMVVDDFGDVYGIFLAITGEGYSLRRAAALRRVPAPRAAAGRRT